MPLHDNFIRLLILMKSERSAQDGPFFGGDGRLAQLTPTFSFFPHNMSFFDLIVMSFGLLTVESF